jgi:hypothetical protein
MTLRRIVFLSGVFVAIIAVGCAVSGLFTYYFPYANPFHYPQFFTDPTCVLPCWQNLQVSESTLDEVERVFGDEDFSYEMERVSYISYRAEFEDRYFADAIVLDDTLFRMHISAINITLRDMIYHLGTPDYFAIYIIENIDLPFRPAIWGAVEIYYVEQGLIFEIGNVNAQETTNGANVCLDENMRASSVVIVESGDIDTMLNGLHFDEIPARDVSAYRNFLLNWQGFTCTIRPYFSTLSTITPSD